MKKIDKTSVRFRAEDGDELVVIHTNRGEPYREGIEVALETGDHRHGPYLFLESREAMELRDLLNRLYPPRK